MLLILSDLYKKSYLYLVFNLEKVSIYGRSQMMQGMGAASLTLVGVWLYFQLQQAKDISQINSLLIKLLFGIASVLYWVNTSRLNKKIISQNGLRRIVRNKDILTWIYIVAQYACVFSILSLTSGQLNNDYVIAIMFTIIAPQLIVFSSIVSCFLLYFTSISYIVIIDNPDTLIMGGYFLIQTLVLWGFSLSASIEVAAKNQLEMLNGELSATQQMLTKTIRQNERLRISRDLHDQAGHHLAALSINLQACSLKLGKQAPVELEQCSAITKSMLKDVRHMVSDWREDESENFIESISTMVAGIPRLQVSLDIEDDVEVKQYKQVNCLLRCIQESITNILKHSSANEVAIKIRKKQNKLQMEITDNGRSPVVIRNGNGIKGMQERLAELMGSLNYQYIDKTGVRAVIELPVTE